MSSEPPRRRERPGRRPEGERALSPEEVAAILAAVQALAEEKAAAGEAPAPASSDAWAAAGRPGREGVAKGRRPGPTAGMGKGA